MEGVCVCVGGGGGLGGEREGECGGKGGKRAVLTPTYLAVIIISVLRAMNVSPDVQSVTSERPTAVTWMSVHGVRSQGLQHGPPVSE